MSASVLVWYRTAWSFSRLEVDGPPACFRDGNLCFVIEVEERGTLLADLLHRLGVDLHSSSFASLDDVLGNVAGNLDRHLDPHLRLRRQHRPNALCLDGSFAD